jgi:aryl-alcohol dehydrogenase-like predicted oxidoreductase
MQRRTFLSSAALPLLSEAPMPTARLGKTGLTISRLVVGGYHMNVRGEETALRILHRAVELGVNFFDSANLYHRGKSDEIYGKAFAGALRQRVMLMTKCDKYSRDEALALLETQLRRMKTDYLDLWQCHQVSEQKEVDQILAPNGALEAFVLAKKQGKVRHIGFTGHHDPAVHLRLLEATDAWETVQMPINLVDPHYLSFITNVLPVARRKGLGVLAMKSNAMGAISRNQVARPAECLRFSWSQDVDAVVSGVESVEQLEENVASLKSFKRMTAQEIDELLRRTAQGKKGPQIENYKRADGRACLRPHRDGEPA